MSQTRILTVALDPDDFDAIQRALAVRQTFRDESGVILPPGESEFAGALLAEICRGWLEMIDAPRGRF